jgi:hypothetical protein
LAGTDVRLKATHTYPPKTYCYWGISSNRIARFKAPSFNGRAGVFYDEFLGQLPRSALGWVDASSTGTRVVAPSPGDMLEAERHPGAAKLVVLASDPANATALLRYGTATLTLQGDLKQSFEFAVRRSYPFDPNDPTQLYECRFGLLGTGDDGVYFDVKYLALQDFLTGGTSYNFYRAWAKSGADSISFRFTSDEGTGPVRFWGWHCCRIDIVPNPTSGIGIETRFFYDGIPLGVAFNRGSFNPVPTGSLFVGARVLKAGLVTLSQDRFLLVDYFQHQLY